MLYNDALETDTDMTTRLFIFRTVIVVFWFAVIMGFAYCPNFSMFSSTRKSINVCTWSGMFDLQLISEFEKQTGIHVNLSYYESNEELFLKLGTSQMHGYDLILPSDYAIDHLKTRGMLKKIDKTKLVFYQHLNPVLLGHYFDEQNNYSVPFEWSIYVIGINDECYENRKKSLPETWALIFDKEWLKTHRIIMTNDPLVAIPLASFYLYHSFEELSKNQIQAIKALLTSQYKWVAAYRDFRASNYLASNNACLAVSSSSYMLQSMKESPSLDFVIPKEGTLVTIESFAIPSSSNKEDLVYSFMNFMMRPENVAHNYAHLGFFPATLDALPLLSLHPKARELITLSKKEFERFHLLRYDIIKNALSEAELQDLWIRIKV